MKYTEALYLAIMSLNIEKMRHHTAHRAWDHGCVEFAFQADLYDKLDVARDILLEKRKELKDQE